jgi:hypothetical protein
VRFRGRRLIKAPAALGRTGERGRNAPARVADVNLERRDLKKGQKAMALAMLFPKANYGGARKRGAISETKTELEKNRISDARLSQARAVLDHSLALAQDVIADRIPPGPAPCSPAVR